MKNKFLIIAAATALMVNSGCDKNFEDLNIDPNAVTSGVVQYEKLLSFAQLYTSGNSDANSYEDWRNNLIYGSLMMQHMASIGWTQGDKYNYNAGYNSAYWDMNYPNAIKQIVDLVENTKNRPEKKNLYNIARIFKVYQFQRLTDMYGDIPYFEAGKGFTENLGFPKYDRQQEIYADMLKELEEAAAALDPAGAVIGPQDLIYQGDVAKWKKFAYSQMLRLAMRMSKVDENAARTWAAKAAAGGVMTSYTDNALVQHMAQNGQFVPNNGNAWVLINQDRNNFKLSKTFVDYLKVTDDPRLRYIGTVVENPSIAYGAPGFSMGDTSRAVQLGMPNGYTAVGGLVPINTAPNWPGDVNRYSIVNRYTFARLDAPTFILTADQTLLLLAEAQQRGWVTGDPATTYRNAIVAAFQKLIQTGANWDPATAAAAADAFLVKNPYNAATALRQINEQYWVSNFLDEYEAWANWRRSGYPALVPVNFPNPAINRTGGRIPRRFTYPQSEVSVNAANYNDAVSRLSEGDVMTSRVWWDKE